MSKTARREQIIDEKEERGEDREEKAGYCKRM